MVDYTQQRLADLKIKTVKQTSAELKTESCAGDTGAKIKNNVVDLDVLQASAEVTESETEIRNVAWIAVQDIILTEDDEQAVIDGKMLQDQHINCAQMLIHQQFPGVNGLQSSLIQDIPIKGSNKDAIQIIHVRKNHWVVAVSHKAKSVKVYDSIYSSLDQTSVETVKTLFS